ncbi:hypothetical protein K3152_00900 [Qipengyuania sp. 1NDH17]|uniref:HEAT repeat domain-containing protein n=1 Tax=Qipengyuania polymorpha TaxID=2867234 RepID=A0ABS7IWZ3_9SPHN|nr:hypothetical protein [Qipengyuania polymorpha]MBX7456795.1 hypothetical protein [Qipengyuania polymorpha]
MRIDPQLATLRGDPASQRAVQLRLEGIRDEWLAGEAAPVRAALAEYGRGAKFAELEALRNLVEQQGEAHSFVDAMMRPMTAALAEAPLGQIPFRHQKSGHFSTLELMRSGRAGLTLITYEEFDQPSASAGFASGDLHEVVLAGAADVRHLELLEENATHAAIDCTTRRVVASDTLRCTGPGETRLVERVHGRLVMLRIARTDENPKETRQYALDDGRLIHRASGSREESRREMAMALLGRMGRKDAAPVLAELAGEGSAHIRWQSLRECLALDSGAGFDALCRVAAGPADPLAVPAGALRAQLAEAYPQLLERSAEACPA